MKKLKKISWLVVSLVALLLTYSATANQNYGDWTINDDYSNVQISLFMINEHNEKIPILCSKNAYITSVNLPDHTEVNGEVFFDYRIDNQSVILKGNNYYRRWLIPGVWYPTRENELTGEVNKYQTLFQQMLKAKQSLTVNLIDAKGHIYRSANFSVKGLPEALIEFAKQCGTDFQTYSGIEINQSDNHNE